MFGAPPGSLGLLNSSHSSWITGPLFLKVLEHVKKHTRSSKEDRIILLMNNHESHHTLDSILYAREKWGQISNFSSPLLSSITATGCRSDGSIKGELRVAQHDWMTADPGKVIMAHDLA